MDRLSVTTKMDGVLISMPNYLEKVQLGTFRAILREVRGVAVAELSGRITAGLEDDEIDELTGLNKFLDRIDQRQTRGLVLDMARVTEIDLAGQRRLVEAKLAADRANKKLVLAGISHKLKDLTIVTKLLTCIEELPTADAAVDYIKAALLLQ